MKENQATKWGLETMSPVAFLDQTSVAREGLPVSLASIRVHLSLLCTCLWSFQAQVTPQAETSRALSTLDSHVWWCFLLYANVLSHSSNSDCPLKALGLFCFLMLIDIWWIPSHSFLALFFYPSPDNSKPSIFPCHRQNSVFPPLSFKSWDKPAPKTGTLQEAHERILFPSPVSF